MGNRIVLTVIFLVFTLCSFGDNVFNGAQWISIPKSQNTPNQWLCFRKQIECADKNTVAKLNIAVDSKYWLWVNDSLVVFEGGLKRGPNSQDTYYDCIDISDFLRKGLNAISIQVWFWGKDGYCHKNSGRAGLLVDLRVGKKERILSDKSWKVKIHPAYGESS